jgi:hypothetical protein
MPDQTPQLREGCGPSRGRDEPFEALDPRQVDAVEDHLELAGGQLDPGVLGLGIGKVIAPSLQTLAPQAQAVSAPVQDLEPVGGSIAENEDSPDRNPLSGRALSSPIQQQLLWTRGPCWSWPGGANNRK